MADKKLIVNRNDILTKSQRSKCMSSIKGKNTRPEIIVRKILRQKGYHYRLHYERLPGKPDIVLLSLKKVIFINGCFWHLHTCKKGRRMPKTNVAFWRKKLFANRVRDTKNRKMLKQRGWEVLTIWDCWLKNEAKIQLKLDCFLKNE